MEPWADTVRLWAVRFCPAGCSACHVQIPFKHMTWYGRSLNRSGEPSQGADDLSLFPVIGCGDREQEKDNDERKAATPTHEEKCLMDLLSRCNGLLVDLFVPDE
ncbi:hypothetical protein ACGVWS_11150 [Enterobacteriaceae bacterium LUAb1]